MEDPQSHNSLPIAQPVRRPIWGWVLLGVLLVCLLFGGFAFLGYSLFQGGMQQMNVAKASGNEFLDAIQSGDNAGAYAQTSSGFKSVATQADTEEMLRTWKQKVGKIEHYTVRGFNVSGNTAGKFTNLNYSVHGSRREGYIALNLVQEGGAWKVQGFNVSLGPPNQDAHPAP